MFYKFLVAVVVGVLLAISMPSAANEKPVGQALQLTNQVLAVHANELDANLQECGINQITTVKPVDGALSSEVAKQTFSGNILSLATSWELLNACVTSKGGSIHSHWSNGDKETWLFANYAAHLIEQFESLNRRCQANWGKNLQEPANPEEHFWYRADILAAAIKPNCMPKDSGRFFSPIMLPSYVN